MIGLLAEDFPIRLPMPGGHVHDFNRAITSYVPRTVGGMPWGVISGYRCACGAQSVWRGRGEDGLLERLSEDPVVLIRRGLAEIRGRYSDPRGPRGGWSTFNDGAAYRRPVVSVQCPEQPCTDGGGGGG